MTGLIHSRFVRLSHPSSLAAPCRSPCSVDASVCPICRVPFCPLKRSIESCLCSFSWFVVLSHAPPVRPSVCRPTTHPPTEQPTAGGGASGIAGSVSSLRQQAGRAGRGGTDSLAVMVLFQARRGRCPCPCFLRVVRSRCCCCALSWRGSEPSFADPSTESRLEKESSLLKYVTVHPPRPPSFHWASHS